MRDIMEIIDALENEIRGAKRTVLGGSKYIDEAKCMDYLFALRNCIPDDIKEARVLLNDRDAILYDAHDMAEGIIEDAHRQAQMIMEETGIVERAKQEANHIIEDARAYADEVRSGAVEYVRDMENNTRDSINQLLYDAENSIVSILNVVRESRAELNQNGFDSPEDIEKDRNNYPREDNGYNQNR